MARKDLARDAAISERYLVDLEHGRANPSAEILWRIAEAMDADFASIFSASSRGVESLAGLARFVNGLSFERQEEAYELLRKHFDPATKSGRGVALIGLRGAGKTTLGSRLADHFGVPFVRLSDCIKEAGGMGVDELFSLGGQKAYRRLEREALEQTARDHPRAVVEAGGSLVSEATTFQRLCAEYHTIWVRAEPEEHMQRVINQGDLRPMRGNPRSMDDLRLILAERERDYALADEQLDTSGREIEDCLADLVRLGSAALTPTPSRN